MIPKSMFAIAVIAAMVILNGPALAGSERLYLRTRNSRNQEGRRRHSCGSSRAQTLGESGSRRGHHSYPHRHGARWHGHDGIAIEIPLPSTEPGVYAFKTDLGMPGRWLFSIAAKVQGEPETVTGKIIFKATR